MGYVSAYCDDTSIRDVSGGFRLLAMKSIKGYFWPREDGVEHNDFDGGESIAESAVSPGVSFFFLLLKTLVYSCGCPIYY